ILRPPSAALFPYTTLFRSQRQIEAYNGLAQAVKNDDYGPNFHKHMNMAFKDQFEKRKEVDGLEREFLGAKEVPTGHDDDGDGEQDRKSTRLNSSHVKISYA